MQDPRWSIDPDVLYLNHGSFGACPKAVFEVQVELRALLEREPVHFLNRLLGPLWEQARTALASFVGADPEGLVFVQNATTGVNTILRCFDFSPGDEILMLDHGYSACLNAARYVAERTGAKQVLASIPFPIESPDVAYQRVIEKTSARTKLAIIDHVSSPTGLVFPIERIVRGLEQRGIDVLVDGAHVPGMLDLDIGSLAPSWYTGNCHKWLCTPKGAAFLWARADKRAMTRPLVISHGASAVGSARFHREFDWLGTGDPTAVLTIPTAIEWLGRQVDGGWPALRAHNRRLAIDARRVILERLSIASPCPEEMLGSLAAIPLGETKDRVPGPNGMDSLHTVLFEKYRIEVPVFLWPSHPKRLIRIAAQLYNRLDEYRALADALAAEL